MTSYAVPRELLVDYLHVMQTTLPAMERLQRRYKVLLYQDSVLIAHQKRRIALHEQLEEEMDRVVTLYNSEIGKRERVEALYRDEVRRMKWWRRGAVGAAVGLVAVLVLK